MRRSVPARRPARSARPAAGAVVVLIVTTAALAGCSSGGNEETPEKGVLTTAARPASSSAAPIPQVSPQKDGDCPYLDAPTVARLNGEKVLRTRIDDRLSPPACFFYGNDEKVQLSTTLYTVDSDSTARRLLDESVPVATSERVDLPGGWTGGKSAASGGAILAVANGSRVFVVHSAQTQTVKVQRVAEVALPKATG